MFRTVNKGVRTPDSKILLSVRTLKGTFERQQLKMTRKREHRSYNGRATWDDFPCVSAKYIHTNTSSTTLQTLRRERERREERKEREEEEEEEERRAWKAQSRS